MRYFAGWVNSILNIISKQHVISSTVTSMPSSAPYHQVSKQSHYPIFYCVGYSKYEKTAQMPGCLGSPKIR